MTIPATDGGTRRTLFRAWLAGIAAVAAHALSRPLHADAANGDEVTVGGSFTGTSTTRISTSGVTAIRGASSGPNTIGLVGVGSGNSARGVVGLGPIGVLGQSGASSGRGVRGLALHTTGPTIGVFGTAKSPGGAGVHGRNDATVGDAYGLKGETFSVEGYGIRGFARTEGINAVGVGGVGPVGVQGFGDRIGVDGIATDPGGIGLLGEAGSDGFALKADGPVQFSSAGIATIASGTNQTTVVPGVPVDAQAKILCTLLGDPQASSQVWYVDAGTNEFTIHMTQNVGASTKVAWFVID